MKQIALAGGKGYVLVDDQDYEFLNRFIWRYNQGYAVATITMHRLITCVERGKLVDHANHNRLDNRRANLRICGYEENAQNRRKRPGRYKGVQQTRTGRWTSTICLKGKRLHLGTFDDPHIAAVMYDFWATEAYGEFAITNFEVVRHHTH